MAEANKDEVKKCKQIAQAALSAGDIDKATRFLQKAKRMSPEDASIDALLAEVASGSAAGATPAGAAAGARAEGSAATEGPRLRPSAASTSGAAPGASRTNKDGRTYTPEQMQMVQRILRTRDYYDILEVPKEANEDAVKKAYKKLALKLHPDKNKAPGAEEAFKKLSKAVQCLTDAEKKHVYDRFGDEDSMPQQHRRAYQEDFMTPEDLFASFFGGGGATFHTFHTFHHGHARRGGGDAQDAGQAQRSQLMQALPIFLLVLLTLASNLSSRDSSSRFSFSPGPQYRQERTTASLDVSYYVADSFSDHYPDGTQALGEFEQQVEIYHVRQLASECDYQEKVMHNKLMIAKRRGSKEDIQKAKSHPRPACKEIEKIKNKHSHIYRAATLVAY